MPSGRQAGRRPPPARTCVACHQVRAKRDLVRVVRSPAGTLSVDLRGKSPGRGAYVCPDPACVERGLAGGAIARALEIPISAESAAPLRSELEEAMKTRTLLRAGHA